MKKVILDFREIIEKEDVSRHEIHEYIAGRMDFPDYYGCNLDALYDCLTDIDRPTAVGIALPDGMDEEPEEHDADAQDRHRTFRYIKKIWRTFEDAEMGNPNLAVLRIYPA